jgi:hypothetical protein
MGLGAGLLGALIWLAVRRIAHLEIGLIALLVGYMVGKAVRKGSGGRGGRGYQVLAVVLTYCCIAANYMPDVLEALMHRTATPSSKTAAHSGKNAKGDAGSSKTNAVDHTGSASDDAPRANSGAAKVIGSLALLIVVFKVSLIVPFLGGSKNAIGLLIIGFALWEAWKFNARRRLPITGPYSIGQPGSGPGMVAGVAPSDSEVIL